MDYPLQVEGFEGQTIVVQTPGLISGAKLLVNGQPAPKGKKRGEMALRRTDGREVSAKWASTLVDLSGVVIDGQKIEFVKPLRWYEYVWCIIPILLIFVGGALGGVVGAIAFFINLRILRSSLNVALRYLLSGGVTVLAVIVASMLAFVFSLLLSQ
jgi:hypothetical protein